LPGQRGIRTLQAGPCARYRRRSSVANGKSAAPATATYHASKQVTARRSSQTRFANGSNGNSSISSWLSARTSTLASAVGIRFAHSSRRIMFIASTSANSEAHGIPPARTCSAQVLVGPEPACWRGKSFGHIVRVGFEESPKGNPERTTKPWASSPRSSIRSRLTSIM